MSEHYADEYGFNEFDDFTPEAEIIGAYDGDGYALPLWDKRAFKLFW